MSDYKYSDHSYQCQIGHNPEGGPIECWNPECPNDVNQEDIRIIKAVWARKGVLLTNLQADELWSIYSDSVCAGWIGPIQYDQTHNANWVWEATKEFLPLVLSASNDLSNTKDS